ncbi:type IV toxin-antitoxin system YeeU family antitoxin, partial [Klebsiella pneumoniae]
NPLRGRLTRNLIYSTKPCEADTLGSCGYVYIAVYPTQR